MMCLRGFATSFPPACLTNSAGERKLPWQAHKMPTWPCLYLYRTPSVFLPSAPMVLTEGILDVSTSCTTALENLAAFEGFSMTFCAGLTCSKVATFEEVTTGLMSLPEGNVSKHPAPAWNLHKFKSLRKNVQ